MAMACFFRAVLPLAILLPCFSNAFSNERLPNGLRGHRVFSILYTVADSALPEDETGWRLTLAVTQEEMASTAAMLRTQTGETSPVQRLIDSGRSYRQFVVARATDTGSDDEGAAIGIARLGRLAVGGFLVLRTEFALASPLVAPAWRNAGVEGALIDELLHRIPADFSAWAVGSGEEAAIYEAAGGEACAPGPQVAVALGLSGALLQGDSTAYRFRGRGENITEYDNNGRLKR